MWETDIGLTHNHGNFQETFSPPNGEGTTDWINNPQA
jgi:hypothetical protein